VDKRSVAHPPKGGRGGCATLIHPTGFAGKPIPTKKPFSKILEDLGLNGMWMIEPQKSRALIKRLADEGLEGEGHVRGTVGSYHLNI